MMDEKKITQGQILEIVSRHMKRATDQAAGLPITLALNKFMFGMIGAVEEALKSADVEIIEPDD